MNEPTQIRIITVDRRAIMHAGIVTLLKPFNDIVPIAALYNHQDLIDQCAALSPDVILMDFGKSGSNDLEMIHTIVRHFPQIKIVLLTCFEEVEPRFITAALQAGAVGYLLKTVQASELAHAIHTAQAGRPALDLEIMRILIRDRNLRVIGDDLTEREHDVLNFVAKGLNNTEIAFKLGISTFTVKNHVSRILSKLEVGNRTEAATLAVQYSIV